MKLRHLIPLFAVCVALSAPSLAVGVTFFESAPDTTTKARVISLDSPYQVFYPYNDYLDGFDVWIENLGAPGTATFAVTNEVGNILSQKSVTVPTTQFSWGGTRFTVTFSTPVPVTSFDEYHIRISSSLPDLYLYYADTAQLRQHDEESSIDPSLGPAVVGGEPKAFSFKFALHESSDSAQPVISNVNVVPDSENSVKLFYSTNERVDASVTYAFPGGSLSTLDFSGSYRDCITSRGGCVSLLSGIVSGKTYQFSLYVKDEWGNMGTAQGSFATESGVIATSTTVIVTEDTTPPVISDIRIVDTEGRSATIGWITNEPANSSVLLMRLIPGMPVVTSIGDATYELNHAISSGNVLSAGSSYAALVASADESQNFSQTSFTFTMPLSVPTSSLVIIPVTPPPPAVTEEIEEIASENPPSFLPPPPALETEISEENGSSTVKVSWSFSEEEEPEFGFRIIIFGLDGSIAGYVNAPRGARSADIQGIAEGEYTAIVYANKGEIFEKVGVARVSSVSAVRPKPFYEKNSFYAYAVLGFLLLLALAGFIVSKIKKPAVPDRPASSGFTIVEILITLGLLATVVVLAQLFVFDIFKSVVFFESTLGTQQEILDTLSMASGEIRTMNQSNKGSFPIEEATDSSFIFFSDMDNDGLYERIRYFVSGTTLMKGVVVPSGEPLQYATSTEKIREMVHHLLPTSTPVFSYYGEDFAGTEPPLVHPIALTDIRLVKMTVIAEEENQATIQTSPIEDSILVAPRSLRTNL